MKTQASTFALRLPTSLKSAVVEASRQDNTSINQFVVMAIAEKLSAMKTAEFFAERSGKVDPRDAISILYRDGGQPPVPDDRRADSSSGGSRCP